MTARSQFARTLDGATVAVVLILAGVLGARGIRSYLRGRAEVAASTYGGAGGGASSDSTLPTPSGVRLSRLQLLDLARSGHTIGNPAAPVLVLVFGDYSCGWCAKYDSALVPLLMRFPDHVRIADTPLLLDSLALGTIDVEMGASCAAEQGEFLQYHRAAYAHQDRVRDRGGWREIAEYAGINDIDTFERCVLSDRYRESVLASTRNAHRLGFSTTPASIIGRQPAIGNLPAKALDSLVGVRLAELRAAYH